MISLSSTFRVQHGLKDVYISVKKNLKTSLTQNSTTWVVLKYSDEKIRDALKCGLQTLKSLKIPSGKFSALCH